jgi:hypothetical protein
MAGLVALLAVGALDTAADPSDTSNAPTEDWVFDEGRTTSITGEEWTIKYNITLMNGSVLKITQCKWIFDGNDSSIPIWIWTDHNSTLEINLCTFDGDQGSTGFYMEANDNITIKNSEISGMVNNPRNNAGLSIYNSQLELTYVKLHSIRAQYGLYTYNCPKTRISGSEVYDVDGTVAYFFVGNNNPSDAVYLIEMDDSSFHDGLDTGIWLACYINNGNATLNCTYVEVYNTTVHGITIEDGQKSYGQGPNAGHGNVFANFDNMNIHDIGDRGFWLCSCSKTSGGMGKNMFNVTLTNSVLRNITNPGMYHIQYYSSVKSYLYIENVLYEDVAMTPTWNRLSAIFYWRYGTSAGSDTIYIGNTTFRRCNPGGIWFWDHGGSPFTTSGIPRYINIYNCTFTECTEAPILRVEETGGNPGHFIVENCTFYNNPRHAVLIDNSGRYGGMSQMGAIIELTNCTFLNHGKSTIAVLSSVDNDRVKDIGFIIENCLIEHSGGYGIEVRPNRPDGAVVTYVNNTRINDTNGVLLFYDREYNDAAVQKVRFTNSTIENSTLTALYVRAQGTYMPDVKVLIENTSITMAGRDAISIHSGPATNVKEVHGDIVINNVIIEHADGIGIKITNDDPAVTGTRYFWINDTSIRTAQRGAYVMGFPGEMWYSEVKDVLLEDFMMTGARVDLWFNEFKIISDQKFKAKDEGSILHFYALEIFVKWDTGEPAIGTQIEILDNTNNLIMIQTVLSQDGALPVLTMNSYTIRDTGFFSNTPYKIYAKGVQVSKQAFVRLDRNREVTIVMRDHIEPDVYILYPKEGHVQQSTVLQVRGTAWDYQAGIKHVLLSLDGVNWEVATGNVGWNHTFYVEMDLIHAFSGVFNLRAKAVDWAGNERIAFQVIRIDPTPPELMVNFPYDGYVTNNPDIWVRGVTEVGSTVKVNGVQVPVIVSMFTHKLTIIEGPNTISVVSIDPLGNIEILRMTVTLDTQDPYFILISPEEREMSNVATLPIIAQLEPRLDVTVNGYPVKFGSPAYPADTGFMEYNWTLEPGENYIVIRVMDQSGNILVIERVVTLDTIQPWIQVRHPVQGEILPRPEVTVVGTAEPTAMVYVNDELVTLQNGYFERVILAVEGEDYDIVVRAYDLAGNEYNETITIFVDTEEPYVEITKPTEDAEPVNIARYIVEGNVVFEEEVTAEIVLLNGLPYTLIDDGTGHLMRVPIELAEDGTFSIPVDLMEGMNNLVVEALDAVGNRATASRVIQLDTKAPTLVLFIDPMVRTAEGDMRSPARTVSISGYTDPGSILTVNGDVLIISPTGEFSRTFDLNPSGETMIILSSLDPANNTRVIEQSVEFSPDIEKQDEETDWGFYALIGSIAFLIVVIVVMIFFVARRSGEVVEAEEPMMAAELAPVVVDEEPEEEVEEEVEEEPAPPAAPRPMPRRPAPRRPVAPPPEPTEAIEEDEEDKDLSDRDAEADIMADEIDQEGA